MKQSNLLFLNQFYGLSRAVDKQTPCPVHILNHMHKAMKYVNPRYQQALLSTTNLLNLFIYVKGQNRREKEMLRKW